MRRRPAPAKTLEKSLPETEAGIQGRTVEALRWSRFWVWITSRIRKRCPVCGAWPEGGDGVTEGLPDLMVHVAFGLSIGGEMKKADGVMTAKQRDNVEAGRATMERSHEALLERATFIRDWLTTHVPADVQARFEGRDLPAKSSGALPGEHP